MILSPRLQAIANKVLKGKTLVDVGTDHGYLPIHLLNEGIVPKAYATDINKEPYATALENVSKNVVKGEAVVLLGSGLKPVEGFEAEQVVIAGMGGELMGSILSEGEQALDSVERLVLQPMSQCEALRLYLRDNGWRIVAETVVKEPEGQKKDHFYQIITAERGEMPDFGEFDAEFGFTPARELSGDYLDYLKYKESLYSQRIETMAKSKNEDTIRRRLDFERRLLYVRSLIQ